MFIYGLLLMLSISVNAFFSPREEIKKTLDHMLTNENCEEMKKTWDQMLTNENRKEVKKYVKQTPNEINYGLDSVNKLINQKEIDFKNNTMGSADKTRFCVGGGLALIGLGVLIKAIVQISNGETLDEYLELAFVAASGGSLVEGVRLFSSSTGRHGLQESIQNLKAIKCELMEAQQKNISKK